MDIHRHIIYTDIYIHRTYIEYLVLDCVSPFFDGGGGLQYSSVARSGGKSAHFTGNTDW